MRRFAISIRAVVAPIPAAAHPDHIAGGTVGLAHYVTDPFHIAMGLLAFGAVVLVLVIGRGRRGRSTVIPRSH